MSGENSTGLGRVTKPRVGGFKTIKTIPPLIAAFSLSLSRALETTAAFNQRHFFRIGSIFARGERFECWRIRPVNRQRLLRGI